MKKASIIVFILFVIFAIFVIGYNGSLKSRKKALMEVITIIMAVPNPEPSLAEYTLPYHNLPEKIDDIREISNEFNNTIDSKLSGYFGENDYKAFSEKGYPLMYLSICTMKKVKLIPKSVSVEERLPNEYRIVVKAMCIDENGSEKLLETNGFVQFNDDAKIKWLDINSTILRYIDPNQEAGF